MEIEDIKESKIVQEFLSRKTSKPNTMNSYRSALRKYFESIGVEDIDNYFKNDRDYTKDVWKFANSISGQAPKSQVSLLAGVRSFLQRFDVDIKKREWEDIATKNGIRKPRPIIEKKTPNNADIKAILSYGDIKSRALFMFASATGMRIDEILSVEIRDIDMEDRHVHIRKEIAKGDVPRNTFFTEEVKEIIEQWMIERERYLLRRYTKSLYVREKLKRDGYKLRKVDGDWCVFKGDKPVEKEILIEAESRLFPFEYNTASQMWRGLLEKAGSPYNQKDKYRPEYHLYNIHSLRRFWFTQMESSKANTRYVDYMGGHESLLNCDYTDFEVEKLKKEYDSHQDYLIIFSNEEEVIKRFKPQLDAQDSIIGRISREKDELTNKVDELSQLKAEIDDLYKLMYYSTGEPPISPEEKRIRAVFMDKLKKKGIVG